MARPPVPVVLAQCKLHRHRRLNGLASSDLKCSNSRGGGRPVVPRTQSAPAPGAAAKTAATLQQQLPQQTGQGSKIIVSNLPLDVTEPQIRELFASTVGPVTRVALSFDARGQSKGTAQVEFKKNDDATKAFQQYNKASRFAQCSSAPPADLRSDTLAAPN